MYGSTCQLKDKDCVGVVGFSAEHHDEGDDLCDACRRELREEQGRCRDCGDEGRCDCAQDREDDRRFEEMRDARWDD